MRGRIDPARHCALHHGAAIIRSSGISHDHKRLPWQEELAIIDRTMKAISGITDPEELVSVYWNGVGELIGERCEKVSGHAAIVADREGRRITHMGSRGGLQRFLFACSARLQPSERRDRGRSVARLKPRATSMSKSH